MLKTIPLLLEIMQCPTNKPKKRLPGPCSWKNLKKMRIVKKNCLNLRYSKVETYSMTTKNFSITYYPTTDEVFLPLGLKQLE